MSSKKKKKINFSTRIVIWKKGKNKNKKNKKETVPSFIHIQCPTLRIISSILSLYQILTFPALLWEIPE